MSEGQPGRPRGRVWQRLKQRKLLLVSLILQLALLLGYSGAYAPILSPLVYPHLAPSGWRNITPHGNLFLYSYAASADAPGLMMACGTLFTFSVTDPSTWGDGGQLHYWLSRDGGATWRMIRPPFGEGKWCDLAMPVGAPGPIFVTVDSSDDTFSVDNVASEWVSYDAGATWRLAKTASANSGAGSQVYGPNAYYRHGALYDYGQPNGEDNWPLTYSPDDGVSWIPISSAPSKLEQQGWALDPYSSGPIPDFQKDTWWYRAVSLDGKPPQLERSTDDGRDWSAVGPIGTTPFQSVTLATTPLHPSAICAAEQSGRTGELRVLSSPDAGVTWYQGRTPASLSHTSGDTGAAIEIGAQGDCYVEYNFTRTPGSADLRDYAVVRLAPRTTDMQVISLGNKQNMLGPLMYIPAGGGMPSRLIAEPARNTSGWEVLSGFAGETSENQLAWIAVP